MEFRRKMIHRIRSLNFNQKITIFLVVAVVLIALMILTISMVSTSRSLREKSSALAMQQLETVTGTLEKTLLEFNDIGTHIISDSRIQDYLRNDTKSKNQTQLIREAYQMVDFVIATNSYLDYAAVFNTSQNQVLYRGLPWTNNNFVQKLCVGYENSAVISNAAIRMRIEPHFFYADQISLNFYQPIYDIFDLKKQRGILTISLNQNTLRSMYSSSEAERPFEVYICDRSGNIVSSENTEMIGKQFSYSNHLNGVQGTVNENGHMIMYNRIAFQDWYVVGMLSDEYLMKDAYTTLLLLSSLIAACCILLMSLSFRVSNTLYKPLEELSDRMTQVTEGDLSVRMEDRYLGDDIRKLSHGFNDMLDQINVLMLQVKEEQHQVEQIKLDALHAQIKPHFLYNTLDCIHWQAAADGNREVSTMIKALATYYRLCLSRGKEVIPLSQEIAHIKSYLLIQNMRYDNIIDSVFDIDPFFNDVLIPKMTLQPLVENSIYHGIRIKEKRRGKVIVRAHLRYDTVIITIADSGTGMSAERIEEMNRSLSIYDEAFGYGVRNVNKRMELIFGEQYGLHYLCNPDGGVTVEIRLPKDFQGGNDTLIES